MCTGKVFSKLPVIGGKGLRVATLNIEPVFVIRLYCNLLC